MKSVQSIKTEFPPDVNIPVPYAAISRKEAGVMHDVLYMCSLDHRQSAKIEIVHPVHPLGNIYMKVLMSAVVHEVV